MSDREAFARTIRDYQENGKRSLLSTGIVIDDELVKELREPGSEVRCGVNLVCRPTPGIITGIQTLQRRLSEHEPDQYYYPSQDLHLTLVEVCHSRTRAETDRIAAAVESLAPILHAGKSPPEIDRPVLAYDTKGAALNFLPRDENLQRLRTAISDDLARQGVPVESRYLPKSAHVTILRYTKPLRTPASTWVEILEGCTIATGASWTLSPLWLTWGASWYGMRSRISELIFEKLIYS